MKLFLFASCFNCYWKFKFLLRLLNCFIMRKARDCCLCSNSLLRKKEFQQLNAVWWKVAFKAAAFISLHFQFFLINNERKGSRATFIMWLNGKFSWKSLFVSLERWKTAGNFASIPHMSSSTISLKRQHFCCFLPCAQASFSLLPRPTRNIVFYLCSLKHIMAEFMFYLRINNCKSKTSHGE